jgi:hypothetical protein
MTNCAIIALATSIAATSAFGQCEDKSQQNAADEAGIKGELSAASKCATPADVARSEKKLEDAAVKAKSRSGATNADGGKNTDGRKARP